MHLKWDPADMPSNPVSNINLLFGQVTFFIFKWHNYEFGLSRAMSVTQDHSLRLEVLDVPKGSPFFTSFLPFLE